MKRGPLRDDIDILKRSYRKALNERFVDHPTPSSLEDIIIRHVWSEDT